MNPRDRRLRLRKSTVVNLNPNLASGARGGKTILEPSGYACSYDDQLSCFCSNTCHTCNNTCAGCPGGTQFSCNTCPERDCPIG